MAFANFASLRLKNSFYETIISSFMPDKIVCLNIVDQLV